MTMLLYFVIIFCANTIGAISGMGGGVIIKPSLDMIGFHPLAAINFYSAVAVFTMSLVSIYKQIKQGFKLDVPFAISIAIGSVLGGILGGKTFDYLIHLYPSKIVQMIQIVITVLLLIFVLIYTNLKIENFKIKNVGVVFLTGLFLGWSSTLLGIGGGPINVALICLLFSAELKTAVVYSIITIFFSQTAKLTTIFLAGTYLNYDLAFLLPIIPAAILGGYVGAILNKKLNTKVVMIIYQAVCVGVILLNIYNAFNLWK